MSLLRQRLCLLCLACLLGGCIGTPSGLEPGKATLPQLVDQLGQPSMVWSEGDGSLLVEFARVTQGGGNFMARVAPNGVLLSLQQVLTDERVATLHPGMSREEVRRHLGMAAKIENREPGEVWHWPMDQNVPPGWQIDAHFGAEGKLEEVSRSRIRLNPRGAPERLAVQKAAPQL